MINIIMQTLISYFYPNAVVVQLNIDPALTLRNKTVFQRTVKIYKGIDNVIRFTFKNVDQKPVNITGLTVNFNMLSDEEGAVVISKGVTVANANIGVVTATLTSLDLQDLNEEFYNYSLSVTDANGSEQVVYTDDNYTARGEVQLLSGHYPTFRPSINVSLPSPAGNGYTITSSVTSDTPTRQQSAHHTSEFYFDTFVGNITVQSTLDSLPTSGNASWANITTITYASVQSSPTFYNWDGVYTAVRFVVHNIEGNVTKILYRA